MLHSTRDWAIQTLLSVQEDQSGVFNKDALQPPALPQSLQHMQTKLFVSGPCRLADVQIELHQSLLAAIEFEDRKVLTDVLELCATTLADDEQFLQFAEAALTGKTEALYFGTAFLRRLMDRHSMQLHVAERSIRQKRCLFDALTMESKICVWANHLPSWWSHLQAWMLEAQRAPFKPINAVLSPCWTLQGASSTTHDDIMLACRRYAHLYVTFVEWCQNHADLLSSCRSMELVGVLSQNIRLPDAAQLFHRQLLNKMPLMSSSSRGWSPSQRVQAFVALDCTIERLLSARSASDKLWQYEWIGVLERPYLLHEALEAAFTGESSSEIRPQKDNKSSVVRGAARFLGWYYSYITVKSADEIAALLTTILLELKVSNIRCGALWLRRNRAEFGNLPILQLRLVWFWLLRSLDNELLTFSENDTLAAVTDVLESFEYIFRRFTPVRTKRLFQVEFVVQLLVELEWRAVKANASTKDAFLKRIAPLCAWLTKIVHLMQLEDRSTQYKDNRNRHGYRKSTKPNTCQRRFCLDQENHCFKTPSDF